MNLDLRIPMGLMFTLVGLILALYGWATRGSALYARAGNVDVNPAWGAVLMVFGVGMLLVGRRAERRLRKQPQKPKLVDDGRRRGH